MAAFLIPVCAGSLAVFIFGMFWYSTNVCGSTWMRLQFPGKTSSEINERFSKLTFPATCLAQALALVLMYYLMSWYGVVEAGVQTVLVFALSVGGVTALMEIPHTAFNQRPVALYFIDQIYNICALSLGSVVISLFF